jgi:hypothetical protein
MVTRYTDEERAAVLAAGRAAIEAAEAALAAPRPQITLPPVEDKLTKWKREANEQEERFARERAAGWPLTDYEVRRIEHLEHRLTGLVDEQKQLVFGVLAEIVAEFEAKIAALSDELGQLRADANIEKAHRVLDLPKLPLRKTA